MLPSEGVVLDGIWMLCQSISLLFAVAEEARGNLRGLGSILGTLIAIDFSSFPPKLFTFAPSSTDSVCASVPPPQFQCLYSK